jgi:hypothetical protein
LLIYLFICNLLNDAISTLLHDVEWHSYFERLISEDVEGLVLSAVSRYHPGLHLQGRRRTLKDPRESSRYFGRDSNLELPELKSESLLHKPNLLIIFLNDNYIQSGKTPRNENKQLKIKYVSSYNYS